MTKNGASVQDGHPADRYDYFWERVKLLVVMAKSFVKGYPLGEYRRRAMEENARSLFYEAVRRTGADNADPQRRPMESEERILMQRIQLLTVMCRSIAQGDPLGPYRVRAMSENIDQISRHLADQVSDADVYFLKVA